MKLATLILVILILLLTHKALSVLDGDTDGQIINRLEKALSELDRHDPARLKISLRLADLHSERARITDMNRTAETIGAQSPVPVCKSCVSARDDRDRALRLYLANYKNSTRAQRIRVLQQIGHLYILQGEPKKAEMFFKTILKDEKSSPQAKALAHSWLGNINYERTEFKKALKHYELALKENSLPRRTHIIYRRAWAYLNLDELKEGIENLEQLLESNIPDPTFRIEVSRDYATFLARGTVRTFQINRLLDLSPQEVRIENLYHLANELDRLGKKKESLMAWQVATTMQTDPNEKLEGHVKVAWVQYDIGNTFATQEEIQAAVEIWKTNGCKNRVNCDELQFQLRKLLTDWDRGTRKSPSPELLQSYLAYLSLFDNDTRTTYAAASLAKRVGQSAKAASLYSRSAQLAKVELKKARGDEERRALRAIFEGSLLSGVESAESSKDQNLRSEAYETYIRENPKGERWADVQYQISHLQYEKGNYQKSSKLFRQLARDPTVPNKTRILSADLALDSLNLLHDEENLEKWSVEFARAIPEKRKEYFDIARRSVMNSVAAKVNNPKASERDLKIGLRRMNLLPTTAIDEKSKIQVLIDRMILARRLRDLNQVRLTSEELLDISDLPEKEKVLALRHQLWVSDMTLDFSSAYRLTQKLKEVAGSDPKTELSLAVYADLAGLNPTTHYEKYLDSIQNPSEARNVISNIVRNAKNSVSALTRYESRLKPDSRLYSLLVAEEYSVDPNCKRVRLRLNRTKPTAESNAILRTCDLREIEKVSNPLKIHQFQTSSESRLKRSVNRRLELLKKQESRARPIVESRDWTLQVVSLSLLAKEYQRFYNELLSLPVPKLGQGDRERYKTLLFLNAEPFQTVAQNYSKKVQTLWQNESERNSILNDYSKSKGPFKKIIAQEIRSLHDVAPQNLKRDFSLALKAQEEIVDPKKVNRAIAQVKHDPFNEQSLRHLKDLKEKSGDIDMANYLNARLSRKGDL